MISLSSAVSSIISPILIITVWSSHTAAVIEVIGVVVTVVVIVVATVSSSEAIITSVIVVTVVIAPKILSFVVSASEKDVRFAGLFRTNADEFG